MLVSILTASIPTRTAMLDECRRSIAAQTLPIESYEHLVLVDEDRRGCGWAMNRLAEKARGEWLFIFADDDLMLPGCLQAHLAVSEDADVVYAPPLVWGNGSGHFWDEPPRIPSHALIRASLWHELGGYDETTRREEDRKLWTKALERGARFVRVDEPQWIYRFTYDENGRPRNKSYNRGTAS